MLKTRKDIIKEWLKDKESLDKFVCPECKKVLDNVERLEWCGTIFVLICRNSNCNNKKKYTVDGREI